MKTAVSIPDEVYEGAERLARRTRWSRSRLFSDALKEYLACHAPDEITETMNRVCDEVGAEGGAGTGGQTGKGKDPFITSAARRILERTEW